MFLHDQVESQAENKHPVFPVCIAFPCHMDGVKHHVPAFCFIQLVDSLLIWHRKGKCHPVVKECGLKSSCPLKLMPLP